MAYFGKPYPREQEHREAAVPREDDGRGKTGIPFWRSTNASMSPAVEVEASFTIAIGSGMPWMRTRLGANTRSATPRTSDACGIVLKATASPTWWSPEVRDGPSRS